MTNYGNTFWLIVDMDDDGWIYHDAYLNLKANKQTNTLSLSRSLSHSPSIDTKTQQHHASCIAINNTYFDKQTHTHETKSKMKDIRNTSCNLTNYSRLVV